MVQSPFEKLTGLQLVKKFTAFHGTRRFVTALTSVRQLSLSWASPIQSIYPHPTSWRSILILSTHLYLSLPSGLFPSGFPSKTLYTPLSSPTRATCPVHLILLDFITRTILGEEYSSFSSSLCSLLHSPVTSSLLGPNILLNTIFSNTLSFLPSLNVSDQVSHPYKTTGKIIQTLTDHGIRYGWLSVLTLRTAPSVVSTYGSLTSTLLGRKSNRHGTRAMVGWLYSSQKVLISFGVTKHRIWC